MIQPHDHHIKDHVCITRPPYRNGKKLRAVKVYTIAQESKYLLVQNIPSIAGVMEQLIPYFNQYGTIEHYRKLDDYEKKEGEFIDTALIKFQRIDKARLAKCKLDDFNFLGSVLHICYAPECESLDDLREKLVERRTVVQRQNNFLKRKPQSTKPTQKTTNEIRSQMRDIMKFFILLVFVLISPIELRLHDDDERFELDDLLNQYDRHKNQPSKKLYNNDDDGENTDDQYMPSAYEHKKAYPSRKKVLQSDYEDISIDEPSTTQATEPDSSTCLDKYDIRSEQLVKVKELKNGAHLIRYVLLDKRTLSSTLNIKEHCMVNCCEQKTCDVAMLSEQPTHEGYKCYLFACNGSCTFASHQDYTIMLPKKNPADYMVTKIEEILTSTKKNNDSSTNKSFFRDTSVIIFLTFGLISTIILFVFLVRHCRESRKRGRRGKNFTVDSDYLINGLYL